MGAYSGDRRELRLGTGVASGVGAHGPTVPTGCFSKDQVYLDGIVRILRHRQTIDFPLLTSLGKVSDRSQVFRCPSKFSPKRSVP